MSLIQEADFGTRQSKSEKLVSLKIDGFDVTVPEGTSIMRAAAELGVKIPKALCNRYPQRLRIMPAVPR